MRRIINIIILPSWSRESFVVYNCLSGHRTLAIQHCQPVDSYLQKPNQVLLARRSRGPDQFSHTFTNCRVGLSFVILLQQSKQPNIFLPLVESETAIFALTDSGKT